jgi:hypothetical protein
MLLISSCHPHKFQGVVQERFFIVVDSNLTMFNERNRRERPHTKKINFNLKYVICHTKN